jgi:glycosyltransferase involved in cell wall biosynthesis
LVPGASLFHATEHLLPPLAGVPTVLTVHDMIFKLFREYQKPLNYWYLNSTMPIYCRRADAIITVSAASKRDIVDHYRPEPEKVTVVHEAAAPEFVPASVRLAEEARVRYGLPERYLIHVGTIEPRKNLTRLVEALQLLHDRGDRIPLVVVGGKGWLYGDFFRGLAELAVRESVYFPGYVPSADLPLLYSAATVAVVPSLYEGFGLPLLEAMACGIPVASSSAESLREVGGEAARYFEATDIQSIADAIRSLWNDADLREDMRTRGLLQAAKFSWDRAARETMAVYQQLMG